MLLFHVLTLQLLTKPSKFLCTNYSVLAMDDLNKSCFTFNTVAFEISNYFLDCLYLDRIMLDFEMNFKCKSSVNAKARMIKYFIIYHVCKNVHYVYFSILFLFCTFPFIL